MDTKRTARHAGQAMIEVALGMFALALVLAALFGFAAYILSSLDMQRTIRREAGVKALNGFGTGYATAAKRDTVEFEPLACEYIVGSERLPVKESVEMPNMGGLLQN